MWTLFANTIDGMDNGSYDHMMNGAWSNNGGWSMLWMFVFMVLVVAGVAYLLVHIGKRNDQTKNDDPIAMVKSRYAKVEINKQQFDEIKKNLK